jgi:osmoprotectant transport system permease protein
MRCAVAMGVWVLSAVAACAQPVSESGSPGFVVGSKLFTESVVLGELIAQTAASVDVDAVHSDQLGGSQILFRALLSGEIDAYPEYTGTLKLEILRGEGVETDGELAAALARRGVRMTHGLGFNNTYALGMTRGLADRLGVRRASDLLEHPELRLGFSNEFLDRGDGWPALRVAYGFPHTDVRGLDHALAYRGLVAGDLDVIDLYSTDAEIGYYGLAVLEDDLGFFPRYDAVILYRADVATRMPRVAAALDALAGTIGEAEMVALNERVKLGGVRESRVAAEHLARVAGVDERAVVEADEGRWASIGVRTREHAWLVVVSMVAASFVAIPLGIVSALRPRAGQVILGVVGIVQTIPSLAVLVLLIRPLGVGDSPAIAALFLYALLPMVRSTQAGLAAIPRSTIESADAIGLTLLTRLRVVEVPLALRSILSGVKTSAVITIGFATLGALIGAGGYGKPILTGIRLDDFSLILEGALPAAGMAVVVQLAFEGLERLAVPRGLRRHG